MNGLTLISFLLRKFWNALLSCVNVCWRNRQLGTWGSVSFEAYRGELAHFIIFFPLSALISFRRISLHVENKQHCTTGFSSQTHAKHNYNCLDKHPIAILRPYSWRFKTISRYLLLTSEPHKNIKSRLRGFTFNRILTIMQVVIELKCLY